MSMSAGFDGLMAWKGSVGRVHRAWVAGLATLLLAPPVLADEADVCARVKIEIKQELTLERQAFDAEMKISNQLDGASLTEVGVVVKVTDEMGTPVAVTDDPNNLNAKFFVRVSNKQNIANVDGSGVVAASSTATINWLIIPAPGSAGTSPLGKKYLVGARLTYKFGAEVQTLDVSPDVITVKPLPLLTLDYFLQQDVIGDDPVTPEIEPVEPFTLGVRVKNTGLATARNLKIDSAQPKIVENNQGLLINFTLTGSYVDDAPVQKTLLVNFGDIAAGRSKMGRWNMESTLAGKFTEFTATFSHADELGGALTSLLQATNAHLLIRDVRVDLPGRDMVRDFLAQDADAVRVYESDGPDTVATDRSAVAQLTAGTSPNGNASYRISFPATAGFVYVKLPDPFNGTKALGQVLRSDAKPMLPENVWLSKTRNLQAKRWEYWINLFDANSTGVYDTEFQAPPAATLPPQIQFIPDRTIDEEQQVSFVVEASSPAGKPVTLSAAPLPSGATFALQAADPQAPGVARGVFNWKPAKGSSGNYLITYTASDGTLSGTRSASIKVNSITPPPGPGTPTIASPASGAQVTTLRPALAVLPSGLSQDPTQKFHFELYRDQAMTQLVETAVIDKAAQPQGVAPVPTAWQPAADLNDNTRYWWRARGFDGAQAYSPWVSAHFFVNLYNDAPENFNLASPVPGVEVGSLLPQLSWTNSSDRDGDAIVYVVSVYRDAALTDLVAASADLPPDPAGTTNWTLPAPLNNHATYYWRVVARDAMGAQTPTAARSFVVNTGNTAPSTPVIASPASGSVSPYTATQLIVQSGTDAEGDLITYVFEIDTVPTFDSSDKRSSGTVLGSAGSVTSWAATGLVENRRYYWRVKAQDGRAETSWVVSNFLMSAANDAPPTPTIQNPGNGAWSSTLQPVLEVNPVEDPEGGPVRYEFEVYRDAALSDRAWSGVSQTPSIVVSTPLADNAIYRWRMRALDAEGTASAWSAAAELYVSTVGYQQPSLQITSPATAVTPVSVTTSSGIRQQVTLTWVGTDPSLDATVALYYSTTRDDYAGMPIVDGLRQLVGVHEGTYVWDVTDLAPGTYYVYGVIYDARGAGRAYAPGAVVIAAPSPGGVQVSATSVKTSEGSTGAKFTVSLTSAPTADVTIGLSVTNTRQGFVEPASLTFTPQNWSTQQNVTVTALDNCAPDGVTVYQVVMSAASSLDPRYAGLVGPPVTVTNDDKTDIAGTTNSPALHVCKYTLVSEQKLPNKRYQYVFTAEWTNTGAPVAGVQGTLANLGSGFTMLDSQVSIGAIGRDETVRVLDTVTFITEGKLSQAEKYLRQNARWMVIVSPAP